MTKKEHLDHALTPSSHSDWFLDKYFAYCLQTVFVSRYISITFSGKQSECATFENESIVIISSLAFIFHICETVNALTLQSGSQGCPQLILLINRNQVPLSPNSSGVLVSFFYSLRTYYLFLLGERI